MAVFGKGSQPSRPARCDRQRFFWMSDGAQYACRNQLIDHGFVSSESAASPSFSIRRIDCQTDSCNRVQATTYYNTGPMRLIVLQRASFLRADIAARRTYTHTASLAALCRFVKLGRMQI